ncbi:unnamed protein product [Orchesella dallaii]|uniref:Gustatory receptor n=1 Tax=Orchesella dallaii TaxID=48710 RepID=A0ABP1RGH7_9HEXA
MARKYSIETDEQNVRQGLFKLYSISIKPCEHLGFTLFSLKNTAELHFNPRSLAFILLLLRHFSVAIDIIIFKNSVHVFDAIYPEQSATEKLTQQILARTTILGDVLYTIFLFLYRKEIIQFHKEQIQFVIEAFEPLTEKDKQWVLSCFPFALRILKRYRRIIFAAFYYGVAYSIFMFIKAIMNSEKSMEEMGAAVYTLPIFYLTWTATSYLRLLQRLVMITLFHGFKMDAIIINLQLKEFINEGELRKEYKSDSLWEWKPENLENPQIKRIFKFIGKLENIVVGANFVFGWCIPLDVLMMLITITTSLFSFIIFLLHSEFSAALTFGLPLVLNSAILFEFFNASYGFEAEGQKCTMLLRQIPMSKLNHSEAIHVSLLQSKLLLQPLTIDPAVFFRVNRKTLSAITSAITTYLIVLVQFHNDEKLRK